MVSPVDKNGGQVDPPGALASGGVLQAAADGGAVTYGSSASFAGGPGAAPASQYLATRTPAAGPTQNITAPLFSGSYDTVEGGVPTSSSPRDLGRGLLLNGRHCRGEGTGCAVANPPLAGTDAPAGYQNYYLRNGAGFQALLGPADAACLDRPGRLRAAPRRRLARPPPRRLRQLRGAHRQCQPRAAVPMRRTSTLSSAGGLSLINSVPGAQLGAPAGAVSADGSRIYWRDLNNANLYLRESARPSSETPTPGKGSFEAASTDGSIAYFTKSGTSGAMRPPPTRPPT